MLTKINISKTSRLLIPKDKTFFKRYLNKGAAIFIIYLVSFTILGVFAYFTYQQNISITSKLSFADKEKEGLNSKLTDAQKSYDEVKNEDQYLKNSALEEEIKNIQNTYKKTVTVYESLLDLKDKTKDTGKFDDTLANVFTLLSQRNYSGASDQLNTLTVDIKKKSDEIAASFKIPESAASSNSPPGSGYQRQKVTADGGSFLVDVIAADIGSTKVIVDTASESDCTNDCPVLSLGDYIKRNNAYAGINGSYFCPSTYPTCAGKTNSFDLLVMNYKKTYFNSGNNIYSSNPAVVFGEGYVRFVSAASEWGRDTSPNGVLSNYPLLLLNGEVKFAGDGDEKKTSKGGRSFVANKGNNIYIGVVYSATVSESAKVMKTLGFENAINLDDGGSTALWYGGYKTGPGRNIPNAILFIKK